MKDSDYTQIEHYVDVYLDTKRLEEQVARLQEEVYKNWKHLAYVQKCLAGLQATIQHEQVYYYVDFPETGGAAIIIPTEQ